MRLLYGHDAAVSKFVSDLIPQVREHGFGECRAIGVLNADGLLIGGMVFHHYWPEAGTIEFSGAALTPKWLTPHILDRMFSYAFDIAGVQLLITRNSGTNKRLHRQLAAYGFERFDIPRMFGRDEDGVFWTLTEEAFRAGKFHARQADGGSDLKATRSSPARSH